jgi:hypothetical protein
VQKELERHLEHCEDCTMIVDQTRRSIKILCDSHPVALSTEVRARLHTALRREINNDPS